MVAAVLGCTICVAGPPDAVDGSPAIGLAADPTAGVRGAVDPDRGDADPVAGRADDQHLKSLSKESRGGSEPAARSAAVRKDNKVPPACPAGCICRFATTLTTTDQGFLCNS